MRNNGAMEWVVCVDNDGYAASLEAGKIYRAVSDPDAAAEKLIRVIDESGEDYLYDRQRFEPIVLPRRVRQTLARRSAAARPSAARSVRPARPLRTAPRAKSPRRAARAAKPRSTKHD